MAKRWRPPFNFKRYCADSETGLVHDLVCEKPECAVSTIEDERITMFDTEGEVEAAIAAGSWERHGACEREPLYYTPQEDLEKVRR